MKEEIKTPNYNNIGYGEKKTLMSFYSLEDPRLNIYTFFKIDDIWQAFITINNKRRLVKESPSLFELCSELVQSLKKEELSNRFINNMKFYITEEETDAFIEGIKEKQSDNGMKLVLVPNKETK